MATSPPLADEQHRERAERHLVIGTVLEASGDEWAVVPLFYAAYHLVKAAMLTDPLWSDIGQLHATHHDLQAGDRMITRHHGRRTGGTAREWGINELVLLLYPSIVSQYERLHQASITVRYGAGLAAGALPSLRVDVDHVRAESQAGHLVAVDPR